MTFDRDESMTPWQHDELDAAEESTGHHIVMSYFGDPDIYGSAEYRAIYETIGEFVDDFLEDDGREPVEFVRACLTQLIGSANTMLDRLEKRFTVVATESNDESIVYQTSAIDTGEACERFYRAHLRPYMDTTDLTGDELEEEAETHGLHVVAVLGGHVDYA